MEQNKGDSHYPMVSLLVPVYNVESYLEQCLESILTQTYRDFEVILCDDGSTDQSGRICDRYAEHYSQMRVIHKENEGLLRTRRRLFHEARGQFVLCVDSDDWIAPRLLEEVVTAAEQTQSDVVLFDFMRVCDDGTEQRCSMEQYTDGSVFCGEARMELCRHFAVSVERNHLWDKLIRRELIGTEEEADPLYQRHINGEDKLQLLPIFRRAQRFCYVAHPLYYYRVNQNGMGHNCQIQYVDDLQQVNRRVLDFLCAEKLDDEETKRAFFSRYCRSLTVLWSDLVLSGRFSKEQIYSVCQEVHSSPLYQQARQLTERIDGSLWIRLLYQLFDRQQFAWMQRLLRLRRWWKIRQTGKWMER